MKISYNWLKKYLPISLPPEEVAELLTNCGLEVEGIDAFQSMKGGLKGLVIGEVKTCSKHPNADKLSLTTVDIGTGTLLNIVCGAPNVAAGQKVVVATVGTMLYPSEGEPFEIKKSKIRGEASEGMICAEDEIGMGKSHAGIIVLPPDVQTGIAAKDYFQVEEDSIFEIGLTPNRADAASHIGVARDLLAVLKNRPSTIDHGPSTIIFPSVEGFKVDDHSLSITVEVEDSIACPRYSGITISGVEVKESPGWLKNKLKAIGVGPINNIVDITNFVLHECGQPLHAFDAGEIEGRKVVVRKAHQGEKFITLDKIERTLTSGDLMICNAAEPMCIAGVFGGIKSGISEKTKSVFLESATFSPATIRKTSKHHGLKTDASFRFERGTDPEMTLFAMKRAALLIKEIAGGIISSDIVDLYPVPAKKAAVELNYHFLDNLLGESLQRERIKSILESLDISVQKEDDEKLLLAVATHKTDVTRPVDVAEEILRIYGFNNIALPKHVHSSLSFSEKKDREKIRESVAEMLSAHGFYELLTNSLTKSRYATDDAAEGGPVKIINALSQDLDTLRQSMVYSGLEVMEYNRNRKQPDLKFYEFGKTYALHGEGYAEKNHLALYITGKKFETTWNSTTSESDFYFLKSFVQNVIVRTGIPADALQTVPVENHEFISAGLTILFNKKTLVEFGSLKPSLLKSFDLNQQVWFADFDWDRLIKAVPERPATYKEISKFPQVRRDLSMIINSEVSYAQLETISYSTEKNLLKEVQLFDVYEGDKIEAGKKSIAMSFTLLDEHQTLTDKQIDKTMNRLMEAFEKQAGAVIRKG